jgi:hypothetical protein
MQRGWRSSARQFRRWTRERGVRKLTHAVLGIIAEEGQSSRFDSPLTGTAKPTQRSAPAGILNAPRCAVAATVAALGGIHGADPAVAVGTLQPHRQARRNSSNPRANTNRRNLSNVGATQDRTRIELDAYVHTPLARAKSCQIVPAAPALNDRDIPRFVRIRPVRATWLWCRQFDSAPDHRFGFRLVAWAASPDSTLQVAFV